MATLRQALLEVLDPEQNSEFYDNFLELGYDLSKVLFIATSNTLSTIQPALLDRMEIIRVSGYTLEEKVSIGNKYLVPKQIKEHGLTTKDIKIGKPVLKKLISGYTRESGVRGLDKTIAKVIRNRAKSIALEETFETVFEAKHVETVLGT
jgi:ATP-dependent Lon protease